MDQKMGPVQDFLRDVLAGLEQPQKTLPCKYFYDDTGSRLFEQICELPEYYLTRTELAIMERHVREMASLLGSGCRLVEFGSGSGLKTEYLLDHMASPSVYTPVDISSSALEQTLSRLASSHPHLKVAPVCVDYTRPQSLPPHAAATQVYFPGSTVGNFTNPEAVEFLRGVADLCRPAGGLLIGFDLQKDASVIEAAYDDAAGVTAAFNLNLLARINRELEGDFRLPDFRHHAFYNPHEGRIEMHLVSLCPQTVNLAGHEFRLARGETIRTEYSYKYTLEGFDNLATRAGWRLRQAWTDSRAYFAVAFFLLG